jgi:hypothetical protein
VAEANTNTVLLITAPNILPFKVLYFVPSLCPPSLCLAQNQNLRAISSIPSLIPATLNTSLILPVPRHSPHRHLIINHLLQQRKNTCVQLVIVHSQPAAIWPVIQGFTQGSGIISVPSLAARRDVLDRIIYSSSKSPQHHFLSPRPSLFPFSFFCIITIYFFGRCQWHLVEMLPRFQRAIPIKVANLS